MAVGVGEADLLAVGVGEADLLAVGVGEADLLAVGVGEADLLAVGVGLADLLAVGVGLAVLIGVAVGEADGRMLPEEIGVGVGPPPMMGAFQSFASMVSLVWSSAPHVPQPLVFEIGS